MLEPILGLFLVLCLALLLVVGLRAWRRSGLPLLTAVRRFYALPIYTDEEDVRRVHLLVPMLHQGMAVGLLLALVLVGPWGAGRGPVILMALWLALGYLGLYLLVQQGRVRLATRLVPMFAFAITTLILILVNGFRDAAVSAYCVVVVGAALLQSGRAAVFYSALSIGLLAGLYSLEAAGLVNLAGQVTLAQSLAINAGAFITLAILLRQGAYALAESQRHNRRLQQVQAEQARQLDVALQIERKRASQLELLNDFARTLTELNDPADLTRAAAHRLGEAFGFEAAAIYLVEEEGFRLRAVDGLFAAVRRPGSVLVPGVGVAGWVAQHDQACWVEHPASDSRFVAEPGPALLAVVAVPLRLAKSLVGVVEVATTRAGAMDASDVRTVESLADLIVAGLQTSQLFIHLRQRQQLTEAVRRAGVAVNMSLDLPVILDTLCADTQLAFEAGRVDVWLDAGPGALRRLAHFGANAEAATSAASQAAAAFVEAALLAGRTLHTNLIALPEAGPPAYFGPVQSLIVAPVSKAGRAFGALVIAQAARARRFTVEDAAAAELLAAQLAAAVDNARSYAAHRRRADELALLNDITQAALVFGDVQHLTEILANRMTEIVGADGCYLTLWDEARQAAVPATASSALPGAFQSVPPAAPADQPDLTQAILSAGRAVAVPDLQASPYSGAHLALPFPARAVLGVPLIAGSQPLGAALLAFHSAHTFTPEEMATAEQAGRHLALALAHATALESERRRNAQLESLREASLQLTSSLEPSQVLEAILQQVLRLAGALEAQIFLYDGAQLTFGAANASSGDGRAPAAGLRPSALVERVAQSAERLVISDVSAHPLWSQAAGGALVCLPLCKGSVVRGVMNVVFAQPRLFDEYDLRMLDLLGAQAALALENARLYEAERRRAVQLTLLSDVSQQVADTLDENVLLQRTADAMVTGLGFAEASILIPAGDDVMQVVALAQTEAMAVTLGFVQPRDAGVVGQAVATHRTYVANDVGRDPHYFDPGDRAVGSALALPLLREAELLGVLYLETSIPNAFTPVDVLAYETLARHVATALQNARLFAGTRQQLRYLTALQSVSHEIAASLELDHIIHNVVHLLNIAFGYRYVSLYVLDRELLRLKAQLGYPEASIIHALAIDHGVMGRAVRTRQTQFVPDVSTDPDFLRAEAVVRSEISVPLRTDSAVLGVLNVESDLERPLTVMDVSLLTALAAQVTVAMVNAQLFEAEHDQRELTEILRAASLTLSSSLDFEQLLDSLLAQAARLVPYDAGSVILFEDGWTRHARERGYEQFGPQISAATQDIRLEIARTPNLAELVATAQPVLIADTALYPGWKPVAVTPYLRSWVGVPIIGQGAVLACFGLEKREADFFTPEHVRRLTALAGQVALALQNARLYAAQRRQGEEQRLLLLAARDLSAGLSQAGVLAATVRHMTDGLLNDGCTVSSWDRDTNELVTLLDYTRNRDGYVDPVGNRYALADFPLTLRVLESRRPTILASDDPAADPAEVAVMQTFGAAHLLMLPLYHGEAVFGLIEVMRAPGRPPFNDADLQLAQSLAAQAAVAFDNAQLHTAVQENLRELNALLTANEALLSTLELEPLLQNILGAALEAVPAAQRGTVILLDESQTQLQIRAAQGYADPQVLGLSFGIDQGFAGRALRANQPLLINEVGSDDDPPWEPAAAETIANRSFILAPLGHKGTAVVPYGVLSLEAAHAQAFTAADLRVLVAFANTAAFAIDNARLHAEVQRLAVTDSLTGLANPRAFEQALLIEFHRASRYGYNLSLVIMDIDSFKHYNDAYGHPAGNERLKGIAHILRANVRDPDLPVRYGGEEFALLLPHTVKAGALALAERIRQAAEAAAPKRDPLGGPLSGYSLSLGVASFPADARTAEELLVAADQAELLAKRGGKNRVVAAAPLPDLSPAG
jgi:diguanylate cyclase (GGDEF)-like protein